LARGPNRLSNKEGYVYEDADITDDAAMEACMSRHRPDAVIHTAAMTNVDACTLQPDACRKVNVDAVRTLAGLCVKTGAHLVHLSTDFVFDGANGPYRETDPTGPQSVYAQSKLDSERIVLDPQVDGCVIRTIIIYGVVDDRQRSNVVLWTKNALEQQKAITVITDQYRSPTLAEDLAAACLEASLRKARGIYHVSGAELMSIIELAGRVADFFKLDKSWIKPVTTAELNQPARRPPVTGFILDKARRDLDYHPHTFEEGLAIVAEQLKKKAGPTEPRP
jgi:dTDP-4-dehydrorhamnose reductase